MTDIEIDRPAPTCIALRARTLRSGGAFIALADLGNAVRRARKSVTLKEVTVQLKEVTVQRDELIRRRARKSVGSFGPTAQRDEPIPNGFRDVHLDNLVERAPIGDEPYTTVKRVGNFETVTTPVFRTRKGDDYVYQIVKPYLEGPWDVTDACTPWWPLEDGREQGFWVLMRLAKGVGAKGVRS